VNIIDICSDTLAIKVKDADGCIETVLIDMQGPGKLLANLKVSKLTCFGAMSGTIVSAPTGGTGTYSYLWSTASTNNTITDLDNGMYYITLSDVNLCERLDTAEILSYPEIVSSIVQTDVAICSYDNDNRIELTVSGGAPGFTYLWSNHLTTPILDKIVSGKYFVTITDENACNKIDSIIVAPSIVFDYKIIGDPIICLYDTIQLQVKANTPAWDTKYYQWMVSESISDVNVKNPFVYPQVSTTYYLTVDSICQDTLAKYIEIFEDYGVDAGPDETILLDQEIQLNATIADGLLYYLWSPSTGLSSDIVSNPNAKPKETIEYILKVENIHGCYEYDTLLITVIPKLVFPSGITPNNDGVNDVWVIDFVKRFPNIQVDIYNRWGSQLFSSKGYPDNERWDGVYNGEPLPVGTYYFIVHLNDGIHNEPISGPITIIK